MKNRFLLKIVSLLVIISCCLGLCACSKKESKEEEPKVDMYTLRTDMLQVGISLPDMMTVSTADENPAELFAYVSDMDWNKIESFFLSYSSEGKADEIVVIALKDEADVKDCKESLNAHLEHRRNLYMNYDASQLDRVNKAIITSKGRYVALIIADESHEMEKIFEEAIKE